MAMTIEVSVATQSYNNKDDKMVTPGIPFTWDYTKKAGSTIRTETLDVLVEIKDEGVPSTGTVKLTLTALTPDDDLTSIDGWYGDGIAQWGNVEHDYYSTGSDEAGAVKAGDVYYGWNDDGDLLTDNPGFKASNDWKLSYMVTAELTDATGTPSGPSSTVTFTLQTLYGGRDDSGVRVLAAVGDTVGKIVADNAGLVDYSTIYLPRTRGGDATVAVSGTFIVTSVHDIWGRSVGSDGILLESMSWSIEDIDDTYPGFNFSAEDEVSTTLTVDKGTDEEPTGVNILFFARGSLEGADYGFAGNVAYAALGIKFIQLANIPLGSSYHKSKSVQRGKHHAKRV